MHTCVPGQYKPKLSGEEWGKVRRISGCMPLLFSEQAQVYALKQLNKQWVSKVPASTTTTSPACHSCHSITSLVLCVCVCMSENMCRVCLQGFTNPHGVMPGMNWTPYLLQGNFMALMSEQGISSDAFYVACLFLARHKQHVPVPRFG